jgi:hypothetical protein
MPRIQAIIAHDRSVVVAALRRIQRRGDMGRAPRWATEMITMGDYASFGPPIAGVSEYNSYRLTERGIAYLAEATRQGL